MLPDLRDQRGIDFVTANGENLAGGMGLTMSTADALFAHGVDGSHRATTSGTSARSTSARERTTILRPLNYGTTVPGRGWGVYQPSTGPTLRSSTSRGGPHAADRQPIPRGRPPVRRGAEALPPVRLVDFHCEVTSEKNASASISTGGRRRRRHPHPRATGTTGSSRAAGLPVDLGMTGPRVERHRVTPRRPASLHQWPADAVRGRGRPRRPDATQIDIDPPPGERWRWNESAGLGVTEGAAAAAPPATSLSAKGAVGRPIDPQPPFAHGPIRRGLSPAELVARPPRLVSGSWRSPPRHARRRPGARGAGAIPAGLELLPGIELNTVVQDRPSCGESEVHVLGLGVDLDTRRSKPRWRASATHDNAIRADGRAAWRHRLPIGMRSSPARDRRRGRPRTAPGRRGDRRDGLRVEGRGCLPRVLSPGRPVRPAPGPRTHQGDRRNPIGGRVRVVAHFAEARTPSTCHPRAQGCRTRAGSRSLRTFDAPTVDRPARGRRRAAGSSRPAARTSTAIGTLCRGPFGAVDPHRGGDGVPRRHGRRRLATVGRDLRSEGHVRFGESRIAVRSLAAQSRAMSQNRAASKHASRNCAWLSRC